LYSQVIKVVFRRTQVIKGLVAINMLWFLTYFKGIIMTTRRQTSIKVDPVAWDSAKEIFKEYNMTVTDAINIFLNRVRLEKGLPFDVKIPSDSFQKSIDEIEKGEVVSYSSDDPIAEMMKDLKS